MGLPGWLPGRPGGDPQRLARMADAWDTLDSSIQTAVQRLDLQAADVSGWWRGKSADAYTATWHDYSAGLPPLHRHAQEMAAALRHASRTIQIAQDEYDHIVEIVTASAVVAGVAAFFTFGLSEAGEAGVIATVLSTAEGLLATLGETLAQVAADIAAAVAVVARIAAQLALVLGGGGWGGVAFGGGMSLALAGGGAMTAGAGVAGATEVVVGGVLITAVGVQAVDALLAKGFQGSGGGSAAPGTDNPAWRDQLTRHQESVQDRWDAEAEARAQNPAQIKDVTVREVVEALQQRMPGSVKFVDRDVMNPDNGQKLTDLDVQLQDGRVIQVKSGTIDGLRAQLDKSAYVSGQEAISYAPGAAPEQVAKLTASGYKVFTDLTDLIACLDGAA